MKKMLFKCAILFMVICSGYTSHSQISDNTRQFYYNPNVKTGMVSSALFSELKNLNEANPASFFDVIDVYLEDSLFNEAAVLYHIGKMRVDFYNSTKPKNLTACAGANISNAEQVFFNTLKPHLRSNIDNYVAIVNTSIDWLKNNEHHYFKSKKSAKLYREQIVQLELFVRDLERNPDKYIEEWELEKKNNSIDVKQFQE